MQAVAPPKANRSRAAANAVACSSVQLLDADRLSCMLLQNHTYQAEVGAVFSALEPQPRLAIATHLRVTPYTVTPILTAIRSTYTGPLAIATDFDVWDISAESIVQRRFLQVNDKQGYEFDQHPEAYDLVNSNTATQARPPVVAGNLTVFQIPSVSSS